MNGKESDCQKTMLGDVQVGGKGALFLYPGQCLVTPDIPTSLTSTVGCFSSVVIKTTEKVMKELERGYVSGLMPP